MLTARPTSLCGVSSASLLQLLPSKSQEAGLALERLVFKANGVPYTQVSLPTPWAMRCRIGRAPLVVGVRRCAWELSGSRG